MTVKKEYMVNRYLSNRKNFILYKIVYIDGILSSENYIGTIILGADDFYVTLEEGMPFGYKELDIIKILIGKLLMNPSIETMSEIVNSEL